MPNMRAFKSSMVIAMLSCYGLLHNSLYLDAAKHEATIGFSLLSLHMHLVGLPSVSRLDESLRGGAKLVETYNDFRPSL